MTLADPKIPEKAQLRLAEKVEASGGAAAFAAALTAPETATENPNTHLGGDMTDKNDPDDRSLTSATPTDENEAVLSLEDSLTAPAAEKRARHDLGPLPKLAIFPAAPPPFAKGVDEGDLEVVDESPPVNDASPVSDEEPKQASPVTALKAIAPPIPAIKTAEAQVSDDEDDVHQKITVPNIKTPPPVAGPPVVGDLSADRQAAVAKTTKVEVPVPAKQAARLNPKPKEEEEAPVSEEVALQRASAVTVPNVLPELVGQPAAQPQAARLSADRSPTAGTALARDHAAVAQVTETPEAKRPDDNPDKKPADRVADETCLEASKSKVLVWDSTPSRAPDFEVMETMDEGAARRKRTDGSYHVPSNLIWLYVKKLESEINQANEKTRRQILLGVRRVWVHELFARGEGKHEIFSGKYFTKSDLELFTGECSGLIKSESDERRRAALAAACDPAKKLYQHLFVEIGKEVVKARDHTDPGRATNVTPVPDPVPDPFVPLPAPAPVPKDLVGKEMGKSEGEGRAEKIVSKPPSAPRAASDRVLWIKLAILTLVTIFLGWHAGRMFADLRQNGKTQIVVGDLTVVFDYKK